MGKVKGLMVLALVLLFLANLPPRETRTIDASLVDVVSGPGTSGSCIKTDRVVASVGTAGYQRLIPQLRLRTQGDPGAVYARWEGSNGATHNWAAWSSAGSQLDITMTVGPPPTYATFHVPWQLNIGINPRSSFTARLVFRFVPYDVNGTGCFIVSNVGIHRVPAADGNDTGTNNPPPPGGGGFSPSPTPTPTPTGAPTPTPAPTSPACSATQPLPSGCVPPPGYCWGFGPVPEGETWPIYPCESQPTASPTPSPAPNCNVWESYTVNNPGGGTRAGYILKMCAWSGSAADGATFGPGTPTPALPTLATTFGAPVLNIHTSSTVTGGCNNPGYWTVFSSKNGAAFVSGNLGGAGYCNAWPLSMTYATPPGITIGDTIAIKGQCGFGACSGAVADGGDSVAGGWSFYWFQPLTGGAYPWNHSPGADPTPTPTASPTPGPTASPSFFVESPPPPNPNDGNGDGQGREVCEPGSYSESLCSPDPSYSFGAASPDPEGFGQVLDNLSGKAPFGYVTQVVDAIDEAAGEAAGGAGPAGGTFGCFTLPRWIPGGSTDTEACVPLQDFGDIASPFRTAMLAGFTLLGIVAMLRWILKGAGAD